MAAPVLVSQTPHRQETSAGRSDPGHVSLSADGGKVESLEPEGGGGKAGKVCLSVNFIPGLSLRVSWTDLRRPSVPVPLQLVMCNM